MKQNEQHLYEDSRWVLYHGTSTARLKRILEWLSGEAGRLGQADAVAYHPGSIQLGRCSGFPSTSTAGNPAAREV